VDIHGYILYSSDGRVTGMIRSYQHAIQRTVNYGVSGRGVAQYISLLDGGCLNVVSGEICGLSVLL